MDRNDNIQEAVTAGIRHIGVSIYSSGKIRDYLVNKGFTVDTANSAVEELISRRYIDDRRAGRKVLLLRTGTKQESKKGIYNRLLSAGIASGIARDMISDLEEDSITCKELFIANGIDSSSSEEEKLKILKTALRRGYSYELASKVLCCL